MGVDERRRLGRQGFPADRIHQFVDHLPSPVADDGAGLTPDQSDAVFSRFSQLEPSEGSGLGLSIVSAVARRHGGQISIDPALAGASLTLELPRFK